MPLAVRCLARLLREPAVRALFTRASGASLLAPLLRGAGAAASGASSLSAPPPSAQLLYEAGLCVWQLTFYPPAVQAMAGAAIVPSLVDLARHASKEKVPAPRHPSTTSPLGLVFSRDIWAVSPGSRIPLKITGGFVSPPKTCEGVLRSSGRWGQVVRVALLALQNLLAAPGLELGPEMVEAGLLKVVQQRLLQVTCSPLSSCPT